MNPLHLLTTPFTELDEDTVDALHRATPPVRAIEIQPAANAPDRLITGTIEALADRKTRFLGLGNDSPVYAFELVRATPDDLRLRFLVPTARAERVLRNHLTAEHPGTGFEESTAALPIGEGDTVGGALIYLGRDDWQPLRTDYDAVPLNAVVGGLHHHAMRRTRFVIQVLFQPIAGQPLRSWWWRRRAYQRLDYLNKEKEQLWGSRKATRRQRGQAHEIEQKAANAAYRVAVRLLVIGAGEYTPARVKEVTAGFAAYRNPETDQYLGTHQLQTVRESTLRNYAETVAARRFGGWSRGFRATAAEVAALTTPPTRHQENIRRNAP